MRVSKKDLDLRVDYLNDITKGNLYTSEDRRYKLSWAYGGVQLQKLVNNGGGVSVIIEGYHSKSELMDRLNSYIKGIEVAINTERWLSPAL